MQIPLHPRGYSYAFAISLLLCAFSTMLSAQGLGVSPVVINQKFKPGQSFSVDVTLSNTSDIPMLMHGISTDLWFDAKTNVRNFPPAGTTPRSAANWVEFVPKQVMVQPKNRAVVHLVITPQAAVQGGYYAAFFFESVPQLAGKAQETNESIFMNFRIGGLLLLSAEGTEQYKVNISDFAVTPPDGSHPMVAQFTLDNQSNTHLFPRVQLTVLNSKKKVVGKADGDWLRFMPTQKQVFKVDYTGELPPGKYDALLAIMHEGGGIVTRDIPFKVEATR